MGAKPVKNFPTNYMETETTPLSFTVKGGVNEYEIKID
jgi:hypothetical protein